jgi:hypothetical protein
MKNSKEDNDAYIAALLDRGMETVRQLDILIREQFKDNPEKLAEWEAAIDRDLINEEEAKVSGQGVTKWNITPRSQKRRKKYLGKKR